MKKLIVGIIVAAVMMAGCTTTGTSVPPNVNTEQLLTVATELALVSGIKAKPEYKPYVLAGLATIKVVLEGSVTYDDLITQIAKQFPGDYAVYAVILTGAINEDKPLFETAIPLLDSYKEGLLKKIDRMILLVNLS